jgi:predicted RecB family nuclease
MEIITSGLFEAFGKCPTKCYRLFKGEKGLGNVFADWLMDQQISYRDEGFKRLIANSKIKQFNAGPLDNTDLKNGQWQFALNCLVSARSWESHLDAIERSAQSKPEKSFLLVPVHFVRTNKVTIEDKLLITFDALVLAGMTGRKILFGKLIYGPDYRSLKVKTSHLVNKVRRQIEQINHCVSEAKAPDLLLSRRCIDCEFQVSCRKEGIEKDDLSLLAGMTEKERKKLNGKGIFTVTQLSYTFRPRCRPKHFVSKNEKYHQSLKALAIRERKVHVVGKPELNIGGTPVYLDVEGLPEKELYFLIGVRIPSADGFAQHSFWADNDKDEKQIWESFLGLLASVDNPTLIHYGNFETTFLKRMVARYGCPVDDALGKAIDSLVNLLSVIYARIYFPTYSNGLKDLAKFLGYEWSDPNVSGVQAIVWRHEWEKSGNPTMKQKLIEYNREDCEGLQRVAAHVSNLSMPIGKSTGIYSSDVISVESLPREDSLTFQKMGFLLPEFEKINQAAYWDY